MYEKESSYPYILKEQVLKLTPFSCSCLYLDFTILDKERQKKVKEDK